MWIVQYLGSLETRKGKEGHAQKDRLLSVKALFSESLREIR